jgi:large subunit ribosomal protein L4
MAEKQPKAPAKKAAPKSGGEKKPGVPKKASAKPKAKAKAKVTAAPTSEPASKPDVTSVAVMNARNEKVRDISLSAEVFAVKVNDHLLYEAVKQYRAGGRRGTHMTKNRALVSGSGKKPWRQKGTGRARVGETRNPLWRHGGTVFGPTPRDYSYRMPKKARAAALRSALAQRFGEGAVRIVDRFPLETPKTRELKGILDTLGVAGKTVIVDHHPPDSLILSGRNLPGVRIVDESHLTVYDVLDCRNLLLSQEALGKLEERLAS